MLYKLDSERPCSITLIKTPAFAHLLDESTSKQVKNILINFIFTPTAISLSLLCLMQPPSLKKLVILGLYPFLTLLSSFLVFLFRFGV
jgi:hypothetical protein